MLVEQNRKTYAVITTRDEVKVAIDVKHDEDYQKLLGGKVSHRLKYDHKSGIT